VTYPEKPLDPSEIFVQADCFCKALEILCEVNPNDTQAIVIIGEPGMVLGTLTIELFLKCLVSIESGDVPGIHNLRELFGELSLPTRNRIQQGWDEIAAHRAEQWNLLEKRLGIAMARDLPSALAAGCDPYRQVRYSYEANTERLQYYIHDLPQLLGKIVLEIKPEWQTLRRNYQPLLPSSIH
jgi:HEPN domain-containing protein